MTNHKITIWKDGRQTTYMVIGGDSFTYRDHVGNGFEVQFSRCPGEENQIGKNFHSVLPEMEHATSKI